MASAEPTFRINPNFRLNTEHLAVAWHLVDFHTLQSEGVISVPGRHVFSYKGKVQVLVQRNGRQVDMIYHPDTDFEVRGIQKWLREYFRDTITELAKDVLPKRVKYWEENKGLHGGGVEIKRLRKSILACCSYHNRITLQPFLVLFKQEWCDEIILHEMAHYRYKNHKKEFWKFLSQLLGRDAKKAKAQKDIELSPYYAYCLYLTKN